jgi:hypothetical protein
MGVILIYLGSGNVVGDCVQILHLLRQLPAEGLVQQRLFEVVEGGEFLAVDGFETFGLFS